MGLDVIRVIEGAEYERRADGSTRLGVEDHSDFPVGAWVRLYVPADRVGEAIDRIEVGDNIVEVRRRIAEQLDDADNRRVLAEFVDGDADRALRLVALMLRLRQR